jgi:membrane-associated protease RseP (regulator of RpoE activity)
MSWTVAGYIGFIVVLLLSVMLHEAGHFLTARRFGMKATEFFVGFGPRLWSFRRGETEYGVKAVPAGGYVRIVGMTELEEVAPEDEKRAFYRQPAPQRAVVLAAGSFTHFVIAFVLFLFIPLALGQQQASLTVGTVSACVPEKASEQCTATSPPSPAKQAGLREGDKVVSVNGKRVGEWADFTTQLRKSTGEVTLVVERDGRQETVTASPVPRDRPSTTDPERTEKVPVLGIAPRQVMERSGPVEAVGKAGEWFWAAFAGTFKGLASIPAAVPKLFQETFGGAERSADGLVGPVGLGRVSGEVLGGDEPLPQRIGVFLFFMAAVNVFIGIFNLLPLLPLDGGHLAVLAFEKARQGVYRLIGRPDPGRVDLTRLLPTAYVFLILIIGLSVLLLAADVINPVSLNG